MDIEYDEDEVDFMSQIPAVLNPIKIGDLTTMENVSTPNKTYRLTFRNVTGSNNSIGDWQAIGFSTDGRFETERGCLHYIKHLTGRNPNILDIKDGKFLPENVEPRPIFLRPYPGDGAVDGFQCVETNPTVDHGPPLGLTPKEFHDNNRLRDIWNAIARYFNLGLEIPIEWVEEYNELVIKRGIRSSHNFN